MITFSTMTHTLDSRTIQKYLMILGTIFACTLVLAALWLAVWMLQEVVLGIAELCHLLTTANPLIITGVLVVLAVWLLGKVKK